MSGAQVIEAPIGLLPLPRPLMTSEVLDSGFRLFRAGLLRCLPYSALMILILQLPDIYHLFIDPEEFAALSAVIDASPEPLANIIAMVLAVPLLGVLSLRLNAIARGQRPRFRPEVGTALLRWPTALIATFGAFFIPAGLMFLGPVFTSGLNGEAIFFLSIPLFWPAFFFIVALPAFWCDRLGPFEAIVKSVVISVRKSWRTVGAVSAALCVVSVFYVVALVFIGMATPLMMQADLFLFAAVEALIYIVVGAFGVPFVLAVLIVAHRDLELRYEERKGKAA